MPLDLDQTSILNSLIDATSDRLKAKLQTEPTDDARAGLVRPGKLQDDPTSKKINLLVHPGGELWPDVLNTEDNGPGMFAPTYTIGSPYGSAYWRRRLRVELSMFFENEASRANSRMKANVVLSRAQHALMTMNMADIPRDDFGEKAHMVQVAKMFLYEGGGDGDFNWRGEMWIEYLTELEPPA